VFLCAVWFNPIHRAAGAPSPPTGSVAPRRPIHRRADVSRAWERPEHTTHHRDALRAFSASAPAAIAEASAERPISINQVAAYFAHTTGAESKLETLELDLFGNIQNWPDKFFGDSMGDLFEMSKAVAQRRQQTKQAAQAEEKQ
jgi:hypothetical protein